VLCCAGRRKLREQLVAVSGELEGGIAVTLSVARTSGDGTNEWVLELEAVEVDRAVRILPCVKSLLDSIPEGRYAVATSGAKTYGALRYVFNLTPLSGNLACRFSRDRADGWIV
jgi:hypothetical protein